MINRLLIFLIAFVFVGCGHSTDKLNGVWVSGDLSKLQSVLVIEDGLFIEYSWTTFRYEAKLKGNEIKIKRLNPFTDELEEEALQYNFIGDTLTIYNIKYDSEYLYIRRGKNKISDIIISNSKRKIRLPLVDFCGTDEIKNEHNIFVDMQSSVDETVILDDVELKLWRVASAEIHESRDGPEERIINLYIDSDVSYKYLKEVELQLRLRSNLRVRYVLNESKCEINKDSTRLQLNYFRTSLLYFMGKIDDSLGLIRPPSPSFDVEEENLLLVRIDDEDKFMLNGLEMTEKTFLKKIDSIFSRNNKYVLIYEFNESATFEDYLKFRVLIRNHIYTLRNKYSTTKFGLSYDYLQTKKYDEDVLEKIKIIKKKYPERLMSQADYEIIKKLDEAEIL